MRIRRLFVLIGILLLNSSNVSAQWQEITPHAVSAFYPRIPGFWQGSLLGLGGAITYKDGVVWAGYNGISFSPDSGKTWVQTSLQNHAILDISFLNRDTGVVITDSIVFLTHDRGKTWSPSPSFPVSPQIYFFSDSLIFLNTANSTVIPYSTDGGTSWKTLWWGGVLSPGAFNGNGFVVSKRGTILLLLAANGASYYPISLAYTRDMGNTWYQFRGPEAQIGADTYSLDLDSCYGSTLYAVQENYYSTATGDPQSDIYLTTDGGSTWTINFSHAPLYLSGSFTSSKHAEYAATVADGILRSTDHGQSWKNIGGPTNKPDSRCIYAVNDNLVFALDSLGNFWSTPNSGGDSVASPDDSFTLSTDSLFFHDTTRCGDTILSSIYFRHPPPCSPSISNWLYVGIGMDYDVNGSQDSIIVSFHRHSVGTSHAQIILQLSDGSSDTILLQGTNVGNPTFYSSPDTLFARDTLTCNDSMEQTVQFHYADCSAPALIQSMSIMGAAAQAYKVLSVAKDSATVGFYPVKPGSSKAFLIVHLDNGNADTILLQAFNRPQPFQYSTSSAVLFAEDSLSLCDNPSSDTLAFVFSGCAPNIVSQDITGVGSADYSMSRTLSSPLHGQDTIIISFKPTSAGDRSGELQITFDDGTAITIPLKGWGTGTHTLTLRTSDESTDTLGGTVIVPIDVGGLDTSRAMRLVVHYEGTMDYLGSFAPSHVKLDLPNEQWAGRSKLLITVPTAGGIAGFATFTVFNDSLIPARVTFDSVEFVEGVQPCAYDLPSTAVSNIVAPSNCGASTLSRWIHLGAFPNVMISPNPTDGDIQISSASDIGPVSLSVFDLLGSRRLEEHAVLKPSLPLLISMPQCNGIYYLRLESSAGAQGFQVIVNR